MSWSKTWADQLLAEVRACLSGARPAAGVPFFLYLYDPSEEVECVQRFEQFERALVGEGFEVQKVFMGQVLARALEGTLYLSEMGRRAERKNKDALLRELARPTGLLDLVSTRLLDGIDGWLKPLRGGEQRKCALLLRSGALFPFVHVSQILDALEGKTSWTLVVPFPGSRHPERPESLRFLNETEGPYYRARIIG